MEAVTVTPDGLVCWAGKPIGVVEESGVALFLEPGDRALYDWTPEDLAKFQAELPAVRAELQKFGAVADEPWPGRRGL